MMKYFFILIASIAFGQSCVTYEHSGGRLGDCLITYLHGKWISYKYKIPLLYVPFKDSDSFMLSEKEQLYDRTEQFSCTIRLDRNSDIRLSKTRTLYIVPYFPEDPHEARSGRTIQGLPYPRFDIDRNDPAFRKIARAMISPRYPIKTLDLPSDRITIAIHVRQGGRFDLVPLTRSNPLKFPDISFYIEGLAKLLEMFKDKPTYCHLFTDALDRAAVAEKFKNVLAKHPNAILDYRNVDYEEVTLEDFFSLLKFDAIIRPYSNFSVAATLIHDYAVVYSPKTFYYYRGTNPIISEVDITVNEELYNKLMY